MLRFIKRGFQNATPRSTPPAHCRTDTLIGKRDRALLTLGFAGAFRRSELVALDVADLVVAPNGCWVLIRRSKTDQEGQVAEVAITRGYRLRPVEAVQTWLAAAEISTGPVFRSVARGGRVGTEALSSYAASLVIKQRIAAVGLDPAAYSGHSLRIARQTRCIHSQTRRTPQKIGKPSPTPVMSWRNAVGNCAIPNG